MTKPDKDKVVEGSLKELYKSMSVEEKIDAVFQLQLLQLRACFLKQKKLKS